MKQNKCVIIAASDVPIDVFNLMDLMPAERSKYYRYLGSLTTPECFEAVIWTVFQQTIKISEPQVRLTTYKQKESFARVVYE